MIILVERAGEGLGGEGIADAYEFRNLMLIPTPGSSPTNIRGEGHD